MARPRKSDSIIADIVVKFANHLAGALSGFLASNAKSAKRAGAKSGRPRRKRARALCYYTGCKNVAAPRFGMFCAAEHKNISKSDKEKYRALHNKKAAHSK